MLVSVEHLNLSRVASQRQTRLLGNKLSRVQAPFLRHLMMGTLNLNTYPLKILVSKVLQDANLTGHFSHRESITLIYIHYNQ